MKKRLDWMLGILFVGALLAHFWPMAYWSYPTTILLRVTAGFCGQLFFCRRRWNLLIRQFPLLVTALLALWGGWLFCTSPAWSSATFSGYFWDYGSPALACGAARLVWAASHKKQDKH